MNVQEITSPADKSNICKKTLNALPNWFGVPESITGYVASVTDKPFFAAFDTDMPVGFVSLAIHNKHTAEIHVMGILESHHRMGLGQKLVQICENYCRKQGMSFLTVKTLAETHPSESYKRTRLFYEAMGFKPLEIFPTFWDQSNPCLMMAKFIYH